MIQWRSLAATVFVLAVGYTALALGTDGWSVWTAEGARRQSVLANPRPLPDHPLVDTRGQGLTLAKGDARLTVVDLIYTQCPTVCLAMGAQFYQLQSELARVGLDGQVELLSITFDFENDDDQALEDYLQRFGAIDPYWRAARFASSAGLERTLDRLGVVVLPEPTVGFVHNAAFYLLEDGQVVEIIDVDDRSALFEAVLRRASS